MNASTTQASRPGSRPAQRPDSILTAAGPRAIRRWLAAVAVALLAGGVASAVSAAVGVTIATSNPAPVAGGAAFSYTVVLTNNDQVNPATDVVMTLPMPSGVRFRNLSISEVAAPPDDGTGAPRADFACLAPPENENGVILCEAVSMPASTATTPTRATITVVAQMDANLASGVRTATATVISGGVGASSSIQQNIQVNAPLSVVVTGPANVIAGDNLIYQIQVNNGGSSSALNVMISDPMPAGVTFAWLLGTGGLHKPCSVSPNSVVTCTIPRLSSGLHTLSIVAETSPALAAGPLANTVSIVNAGTGSIGTGTSTTTTQVAVNAAPVAVNDSYVTNLNTALPIAALGVKANDTDDEDLKAVMTAALVAGPSHGMLTAPLAADGSFTYTPTPGYTGPDSFTYQLTDSRGALSNVATVTLRVNAPPVANGDAYVANLNTPLAVSAPGVKGNDSDDFDAPAALAASIVTGPANGTLTGPLAADGSFTYTPTAGYSGPDSFTYRVTDSNGLQSNIATVTIRVNAPPVALDDGFHVNQPSSLVVAAQGVKVNDSDDFDAIATLTAAVVNGPAGGTLTGPLAADGSFTYTPNPGFVGIDSFTYRVTDSDGLVSNTATVTIQVYELVPVPVAPWLSGLLALMLAGLGFRTSRARLRGR